MSFFFKLFSPHVFYIFIAIARALAYLLPMSKPAPKTSAKQSKPKFIPRKQRKPTMPPPCPDDVLTPQEELFVELYFVTGFNVSQSYSRAGYKSPGARANTWAYHKIQEPHIQAAIARRRVELRERTTISKEEKLKIVAECILSPRANWRDRLFAVALHSRMVGELGDSLSNPLNPPDRSGDEITPGALRALTQAELIETINSGRILKARAKVIDVQRSAPALPAPAPAAEAHK